MNILKSIKAILFVLVFACPSIVNAHANKREQYLGVADAILNRSIAKFIYGEYAGIPRDAPPCKPETTVKEAFDQPCKLFKLKMSLFDSLFAIIDIEFYSIEAKEMFSKNTEFIKFMDETATKISKKEKMFELGEFAHKKNREFVRKSPSTLPYGFDTDADSGLFLLVWRYISKVKFYPEHIEIWRK